MSLAGAYALGYCGLAMAQIEDDGPDWFHDLDPLETLFLGTAWPKMFADSYEFANACSAWLRLMRDTVHWAGIERFVREIITASEEHDLPVDLGELMLLAVGRLEGVGLDQRKLPAQLMPEVLLAGSRFITGPDAEIRLPAPPASAEAEITQFWSAVEVSLPGDGTAADALREGLHMMRNAGLDIRSEPAVLLPALYAALVADDDEDLAEAGERAVAWALGLRTDSPLIPVTDVLLVAPQRDLDTDTILGHLFGMPAFTEQVSPEDRTWHSEPGRAFIDLAFDLGYRHIVTRHGKAVRMDGAAAAAIQTQMRKFEEKFGRPPGPDDPIFFDPDADEPRPVNLEKAAEYSTQMLEAAGISPAWIYAYERTNGLLPLFDGTFATERDRAEWDEAINEYIDLHDADVEVDHAAEMANLRGMFVVGAIQMAEADPQYASSLVNRLVSTPPSEDGDVQLLDEHLTEWEEWLLEQLRSEPSVLAQACEHARAWAGIDLAERVKAAAESLGERVPKTVLLAIAVAAFPSRKRKV